MLSLTIIQKIAVWVLPVLFAITLHEAAHAYVAYRCGDTTAKMLGRLSLNPLRHVDLIGTILVPLVVGALSQFQFVFGWAKPVPINWNQLRNPRRDMILVTAAGPLANLAMAILWASCLKMTIISSSTLSHVALFLLLSSQAGILINLLLTFLNLIPIPPLDGSRIVASLLPSRYAFHYLRIEPFGFLILVALMLTGILGMLLNPLLDWSIAFIKYIFNI